MSKRSSLGWGRAAGTEWRKRKGTEDMAKRDQFPGDQQVGREKGAASTGWEP